MSQETTHHVGFGESAVPFRSNIGVPEGVHFEEAAGNVEGVVSEMGRTAVKELVQTNTEIIDLGMLSALNWPGGVSARKMVDNKETTDAVLLEARQRIGEFYVPTSPTAKTRCIDGRHDPELDETNLGPQVPGGAPGAALAYRLGVDRDDLTRGTFFADAQDMVRQYIRLGFAPGGHRDEHSEGDENKVGCGAIDGMDAILATMTRKGLVDDHKRVVKQLMGADFDRDTYLRVMGAAVVVNDRSEEYFAGRDRIIDELEKRDPKSVSVLKGDHKECFVVVNTVPGTTLSSNRFSETFKGVQAFGYDLWRSKQIAQAILPDRHQEVDRKRFVMARIMSTVATLMALTDGSQRLMVRTEK